MRSALGLFRTVGVWSVAIGVPTASFAQAAPDTVRLSLAKARELALHANPDLQAARLDMDIARGELRQASVLLRFNPEVDVLAAAGVGAELGIGQELEIAGQRGARRAAARAGLERAAAGVVDFTRTMLGDVDRAFYRFVAADRRTALADEVLALNGRLASISEQQLQAGKISGLEFNLATVEFGRARARALAARRQREGVASELRRLLGIGPTDPIATDVDSAIEPLADTTAATTAFDIDSLTALALSRRPDLVERAAAVRQAGALASVAGREAIPNLLLRAQSQPVEGNGNRDVRVGLGLTLPVFNRNRGEVHARRAAQAQADLVRASLVARVRTEVSRAVASYRSAALETGVLGTAVLRPARENRRLLEIAYREGKVGLAVLLLIRNQVIDAELEYWEAWLAEREALADLAEATGETVIDLDPSVRR